MLHHHREISDEQLHEAFCTVGDVPSSTKLWELLHRRLTTEQMAALTVAIDIYPTLLVEVDADRRQQRRR